MSRYDAKHPGVSSNHMKLLRIVRSCMSTSNRAIQYGIQNYDNDSISSHDYSAALGDIEECAPRVHCIEGVVPGSKHFRTYISNRHGAICIFPDLPRRNALTIVFRQSFCPHNWISNMQWLPRVSDGIHTGFYTVGSSLMGYLTKSLNRWQEITKSRGTTNSSSIYFTGMSLGGALAALMAYRVSERDGREGMSDYLQTLEVVQFASPKIGIKRWADNYNRILGNQTTHYHSPIDLFANSPPMMAGDYQHVGQIIHTTDFGHKGNPKMIAHSKILGISWTHGLDIWLGIHMMIRGNRIMKDWKDVYSMINGIPEEKINLYDRDGDGVVDAGEIEQRHHELSERNVVSINKSDNSTSAEFKRTF